jgi:hypothetical protein
MRLAIIVSVVLGLAACGGDPTPKEACNDLAAALCNRFYECFTAAELAAGGFPPSEAGCTTKYQTDYGCSAQTVENTCDGNEKYHGGYADDCVDQLKGVDCSQIRDPNFDFNAAVPACDKVCSI